MDLTEAEDIKKRWQEYTEELYKKDLHDPDNHDGVITHLEPDILECKVKWALGSITTNKASGGDGIPVELFQILKDDAVKVLHSVCQQIWKTLCLGFFRQEDWSRLPFLLQWIFPTQRLNPRLLHLLHWHVDSLPLRHLGNHVHLLWGGDQKQTSGLGKWYGVYKGMSTMENNRLQHGPQWSHLMGTHLVFSPTLNMSGLWDWLDK